MRLIVSPDAPRDLDDIDRYGQREWGRTLRDQYMAVLRARFVLLLGHPDMGAPRCDLGVDFRNLPVGRHMIFYRVSRDAVRILRVLHQRMDAKLHI